MSTNSLEEKWAEVISQIKKYEGVDSAQINAFFDQLRPQAMSDGFLMLTASNDFIKKWIESHYSEYILRALQDVFHTTFTLVIEVYASPSSSNTPSQQRETIQEHTPSTPRVEKPLQVQVEKKIETPSQPQKIADKANRNLDEDIISSLTFENFVIGESNEMAYRMAVTVAETPGKPQLNPLFIYGRSGLGKTHLMRAIQNYVNETYAGLTTLYVDTHELLSDYMDAAGAHDKHKDSYKNFQRKYEQTDILLIDDVQYLQGKIQTLDMVFTILNKRIDKRKQVVLSADRAPKNIDIDERYISRFNSGGTCDIQPPELETKLGIVKSFLEEYRQKEDDPNFDLSEDVKQYIAECSSSNIRELKSAVTKVIYHISFSNKNNISVEEVKTLLENHFSGGPSKRLTIGDIQKVVENYYKVSHADLIGKTRSRGITFARQVAIYLCRDLLGLPYNDIGKKFNRDHSTIMYTVTNVETKVKESRVFSEEINNIKQIIREN